MKTFFNMGQTRPLFVYFRPFLNTATNIVKFSTNGKSIDGVLGMWTRDCMMDVADESTEQWHPLPPSILNENLFRKYLMTFAELSSMGNA